ncbi:hypothetical protein FJZ36_09010 [Candidatus Poribacteria bacterium]|nr:hypothetical protein [Candidatus Poribacteria bacterium]
MVRPQPHASSPSTIWYDDFDGPVPAYGESQGDLSEAEAFGGEGRSMLSLYESGSRGIGNRKVFFGDAPLSNVVQRGRVFTDVYWRIYVKYPAKWIGGGPAKLSRATSLASPNWSQAMIAHVWTSGDALTLDPASGVRDGEVVTRKYNDFERLRWLGNRPASGFQMTDPSETGRWVCVEARAKLNTPGIADGENQLWIDGILAAERTGLDWRGSYSGHGINAVFLETYWNEGSPVAQSRWIDSFVIATEPIGPVVCPVNPELIRTPHSGPGGLAAWQVEIAEDAEGHRLAWRSHDITDPLRVRVGRDMGEFVADDSGTSSLEAGRTYWSRVRQRNAAGVWSSWSPWHQPFATAADER